MGEKEHFQHTFKVMYGNLKDGIKEYQKSPTEETLRSVEAYLDAAIHAIVDYAERYLKYEGEIIACYYVNNTIKHIKGYTVPRTISGGLSFPTSFPLESKMIKLSWKSEALLDVDSKNQKEVYKKLFAGKEILEPLEPLAEMIEKGIEQK